MSQKKKTEKNKIEISPIYAMAGICLGVQCYRGFAPLSILSKMSQADEYHQNNNPNGTQRNLKPKHAREAYEFAKNNYKKENSLWPEIILNIRIKDTIRIKDQARAKGPKDANLSFVKIQINWDKLNEYKKNNKIAISRVDGNHRLYFAGGEIRPKTYTELREVYSPFCIIENIAIENERSIFRTINAEQKKLDVSHLLRIEQQLTPDDVLWTNNKALWIVTKLGNDGKSPFCGQIHKGGKKTKGETYLIKQKSLLDGVRQLLRNFPQHASINNKDTLFSAVVNYFNAVHELWPSEWMDSRNYKLMTNTGMQTLGIIGGKLMSELLTTKSLKKEGFQMKLSKVKRQIKNCWDSKGDFTAGKSGRPGAQKIADEMYEIISDTTNINIEV
ncbi:DGQHR domain-containing protein [bacterium]|jgi:hypothetical protein|nr:DGQHR domain-containing protein [bacterium]